MGATVGSLLIDPAGKHGRPGDQVMDRPSPGSEEHRFIEIEIYFHLLKIYLHDVQKRTDFCVSIVENWVQTGLILLIDMRGCIGGCESR